MTKDKHFDKYDKFGAYHWDAYENDQEYRAHVDHVCGWVSDKLVLDVGAGDGLISAALGKAGKYVSAIDSNKTACDLARKNRVMVANMSVYEIVPQAFDIDAVYLGDVLEHLAEPAKALSRIHAVLPEGGTLYVVVPAIKDDHADTQYTENSLVKLVTSCGFEVKDKPYTIASRLYASFTKIVHHANATKEQKAGLGRGKKAV